MGNFKARWHLDICFVHGVILMKAESFFEHLNKSLKHVSQQYAQGDYTKHNKPM
jgi:hypothetical protein